MREQAGICCGETDIHFVISFDKHQQWPVSAERVKLNSLTVIIMGKVSYYDFFCKKEVVLKSLPGLFRSSVMTLRSAGRLMTEPCCLD